MAQHYQLYRTHHIFPDDEKSSSFHHAEITKNPTTTGNRTRAITSYSSINCNLITSGSFSGECAKSSKTWDKIWKPVENWSKNVNLQFAYQKRNGNMCRLSADYLLFIFKKMLDSFPIVRRSFNLKLHILSCTCIQLIWVFRSDKDKNNQKTLKQFDF